MVEAIDLYIDSLLLEELEAKKTAEEFLPEKKQLNALPPLEFEKPKGPLFPPSSSDPNLVSPSSLGQKKKICTDLLLVKITNEISRANNNFLQYEESEIQASSAYIRDLQRSYFEVVEQQIAEAQNKGGWEDLIRVAGYLSSCGSIALGAFLASQGDAQAAKYLISAGGLGLFGHFMKDTDGFDYISSLFSHEENIQKNVAGLLEMSFIALSFGVGIFGTLWYGSHHTAYAALSRLPQNREILDRVKQAFVIATSASSCFLNCMHYSSTKKFNEHDSRAKYLDGKRISEENLISMKSTNVALVMQTQNDIITSVNRAIAQYGFY